MSDFIRVEGETCPAEYRHVTYVEALENARQLCSILKEWDIARLAHGASMDGCGYNCKIRPEDERPLGHSLCVREQSNMF
ncbi:hypothetical protein AB0758_46040 [Tolypothrix bouteillei VB521301_2]|uniref:Uncharacterized protein n=1 Tax=Tolypothrix bouteillei VB521301 TaxID=1479485 RepID=A0A0C1N1W8_9CYAN